MKRLLLLLVILPMFALSQNDSIKGLETIKKVNFENFKKKDFKGCKVIKDDFDDSIKIQPRSYPTGVKFAINIIIMNNVATPTLTINYVDSSWLFVKSLTVKYDDEKFDFDLSNSNREIITGTMIREYKTYILTTELLNVLKNINSSNDVLLRFYGDNGKDDKGMNGFDERMLDSMLSALDKLYSTSKSTNE